MFYYKEECRGEASFDRTQKRRIAQMRNRNKDRKRIYVGLAGVILVLSGCGRTDGAKSMTAAAAEAQESAGKTAEADETEEISEAFAEGKERNGDLAKRSGDGSRQEASRMQTATEKDAQQGEDVLREKSQIEEAGGIGTTVDAVKPAGKKTPPEGWELTLPTEDWGLAFGEPGTQPQGNASAEDLAWYDAYYVGDDLNIHAQIARHLPDDRKLLRILLPKIRPVCRYDMEELTHHRLYPSKMRRTTLPAQFLRQSVHIHIGTEILVIHLLRFRVENQVYPCAFTKSGILLKVPRITGEIFIWSKLDRIDENADCHFIVLPSCRFHQTLVSLMQIPHRRDQSHTEPFSFPFLDLFSRLLNLT